jgi:membrane-bound metal-dependent hydrolase YbcI (DUF457 family)
MADPVTHVFLGMAIAPRYPILGALFGMLPDAAQLIAAIQVKSTAIWREWARVPEWTKKLQIHLHSIWWPLFALFAAWLFIPVQWSEMVTALIIAYLSHIVIDMWTHDRTGAWEPFVKGSLELGTTYHDFRRWKKHWWYGAVVLIMVWSSFQLSHMRGAWDSDKIEDVKHKIEEIIE